MTRDSDSTHPTVLRRRAVERRIGLKRSALYKAIAEGSFPRPVKLGRRAVGWLESEVSEWLRARIAESRGVAK